MGDRTDAGVEAPLWVRLIFPITFVAYETVLVSRNGRTIGKMLFRTTAIEWTTGELPTPKESFIRAIVPGIFYFLYLLPGAFSLMFFLPPVIYLTSWPTRSTGGSTTSSPTRSSWRPPAPAALSRALGPTSAGRDGARPRAWRAGTDQLVHAAGVMPGVGQALPDATSSC